VAFSTRSQYCLLFDCKKWRENVIDSSQHMEHWKENRRRQSTNARRQTSNATESLQVCVCVCVCGNTVNYAAGERALRLTRNEHRHWHSHNSSRTVVEWAISATHCQFFSHAFVHQMRQIYFDFQQLNCISSNIYVLNTNGILLYILTPFFINVTTTVTLLRKGYRTLYAVTEVGVGWQP